MLCDQWTVTEKIQKCMDGGTFNPDLEVGGESYPKEVIFKLRPLFFKEVIESESSSCQSGWHEVPQLQI